MMRECFAKKGIAAGMAALLAASLLMLSGCVGPTGSRSLSLAPKLTTPAVATAGVLRVGVDSTHPPYAGISDGKVVGIDVDVAAALADDLGLRLEIVDLAGQNANDLLSAHSIDLLMDVEQSGGTVIQGLQVGPYMESGPALFTIVKGTTVPAIDLKTLAGTRIAAQQNSLSAWSVEELIGKGTSDPRDNLIQAFEAVAAGSTTYVAADAIVGSYLALDYNSMACVKLLGTPIGVYIGVAGDNAQLADALTASLRSVRDNGVLKVLLTKWLGAVSATVVMGNSAVVSQQAGGSTTQGTTPGAVDTGDDLPDPANAGGTP